MEALVQSGSNIRTVRFIIDKREAYTSHLLCLCRMLVCANILYAVTAFVVIVRQPSQTLL